MGLRESIAGVTPFAEISRGRMTIVYKGFDPSHDRFVLLKILRPEYSRLPVVARKFGNEASLLAKVSHPNVVTVLTAGTDGDTAYLVTEFVEGVSLSELLRQRLPPPEIAAFIAKRILSGLGAAHEAGVLHRDLKPDNVLISADGQVKISDFGLAVDTKNVVDEQPLIAGTLGFLAPEVVAGQAPTVLSDLFSCGATLYEMLTGQAAFGGHSDGQVIDAVLNHNPMNGVEEFSSAPAGLLVLCSRMLRKDPTDRVASCEDAVGAIDRWFVDSGLNTEPSDLARYVADPLAYPKVAVGDPAKTSTLTQHPPTGRTIRWAAAAAIVVLLGFATIVVSRTAGTDPTVDRAAQQDSVRAAALGPAQGSNPGSTDALQNRQRDRSPAELGDQAAETGTAAFPPAAAPARHGQSSSDEGKPRVENETVPSTLLASPAQNHQDSDVAAGTVGGALTDGPSTPQSQQAAPTDKQRIDDVVTGTLSVRSVPWASVWLDGEPYGTSLTDSLELVPGSYELVLRNPEFPDVIRTVDVEAGAHRDVEISLWSTVARLTLMVVPWAIVEIDGAVRDTIPPQTKPLILSPGTHTLRLIHPELGDIVRDVRLIAGEERILAYNMRQASAQ